MAWTNKQKATAQTACKAARISNEQRVDLILRNFPNASYGGDITSTSPKLTNHDFEQFMAIVENFAGGQVLSYGKGHWQAAAADRWQRMRRHCQGLADALQTAGIFSRQSLSGWIEKRTTGGRSSCLEELDYHALAALTLQLESFCRQKGISDKPRGSGKGRFRADAPPRGTYTTQCSNGDSTDSREPIASPNFMDGVLHANITKP